MSEARERLADGADLAAFLLERLASAGISERQAASALAYHGEVEGRQPLSRTLVELGLVTDETAARWIAEFQGWRYVAPEELRVEEGAPRTLPESIARSRHALVVSGGEAGLTVAVADPTWPQFAQVRYALEDRPVQWVVSPQADIAARVCDAYSPRLDVGDNEAERFVEDMIRKAAHTRGLSDIHCIPEDCSCEIRWRIDGDLIPWGTLPASRKETIAAQIKLSSTRGADGRSKRDISTGGLDVANRIDAQDASAVRQYGSKRVSLRYSVIPVVNGESIVIRILDQSAQVGSLEDLGMLPDMAMRLRAELRRPNGIVFVSGPTGHGKSTTLAASVPCLDSRGKRVLSVEDPVEYRLRTVTQAPVGARLTFASALRAFLRHNPDIVMVGEIRDAETASLAIRLALTGHLILTTVHANSAVQAVSRMIDLGAEESMVAGTARFLLGQRLVKRLCPACRKPHRMSRELADRHGRLLGAALRSGIAGEGPPSFFEAGGGCAGCGRTGYSGRIGIFEHRDMRPEIARLLMGRRGVFDSAAAEAVFSRACESGDVSARSIREDGVIKAALGLTTPEEVYAATLDAPAAGIFTTQT